MIKSYIKQKKVLISDLLKDKELKLTLLEGKYNLSNVLKKSDVNRTGLSLAGLYKNFGENQIQIFSLDEFEYLNSLSKEERERSLDVFFEHNFPAIILSKNSGKLDYLTFKCKEHNIPLLKTEYSIFEFIRKVFFFSEKNFNPKIVYHGELVEVYGVGILILGESGVGKSEFALELIKRNHIFIADDIVEIYKNSHNELIGKGSEIIKYHLEIRGIGIINIKKLFGIRSIKDKVKIDLVVNLEYWDQKKEYDRTGLEENFIDILEQPISNLFVPVKVGRNIAAIIEVAAMNYRSKKLGIYNSQDFNKKIINWIQGKQD